ncbi:hypothetical protein EDC94DRAFT_584281 [Helicostylum pulchrum]|nr:hypothetical protein EDC94DRAFT_584281 [Helicostylum pulchrum]
MNQLYVFIILRNNLEFFDASCVLHIYYSTCKWGTSDTVDWLFDILRLCPVMKEITLLFMSSISPSDYTTKYLSVKKLTEVDGPAEYNFLNYVSLNFPYLQLLSLNFRCTDDENIESIKIDMPHTSLNLLTCKEDPSSIRFFKGAEVYIKLKTDEGLMYFVVLVLYFNKLVFLSQNFETITGNIDQNKGDRMS